MQKNYLKELENLNYLKMSETDNLFRRCPICGNLMYTVQYGVGEHDHQGEHYPGWSEWRCTNSGKDMAGRPLCGVRQGRWSKKWLKDGEWEPRPKSY